MAENASDGGPTSALPSDVVRARRDNGESGDGRHRRGAASRRLIMDAACGLVTTTGVESLTHRRVAAAAGMPPARVSYHFPTVDDLLLGAAQEYLERFEADLRERASRAARGEESVVQMCTALLHELVTDGAPAFLAMVGVRVSLARRGICVQDPGIVPLVQSFGVSESRARSIGASMFGFAVLAAADPSPTSRAEVESHVRTVIGGRP